MMERPDLLLPIPMSDDAMATLDAQFTVHRLFAASDPEVLLAEVAPRIRAIACGGHYHIGPELIDRLPQLEIIAGFGVGYDHIDAAYAETRGVIVTNTPDVLTEEVADTALGLLLMTVRELSAAERHLRAGKWPVAPYRLSSASLRDRTVGIAGMGRVGSAIARRLAAFGVPVVYYKRTPDPTTDLRFYDDLVAMAADVDICRTHTTISPDFAPDGARDRRKGLSTRKSAPSRHLHNLRAEVDKVKSAIEGFA